MLTPEQFDRIEWQCWNDQLVDAVWSILATRNPQPKSVVAKELASAMAALGGGALAREPDARSAFVKHQILEGESTASWALLRAALAALKLSATEVAWLSQLTSVD